MCVSGMASVFHVWDLHVSRFVAMCFTCGVCLRADKEVFKSAFVSAEVNRVYNSR